MTEIERLKEQVEYYKKSHEFLTKFHRNLMLDRYKELKYIPKEKQNSFSSWANQSYDHIRKENEYVSKQSNPNR